MRHHSRRAENLTLLSTLTLALAVGLGGCCPPTQTPSGVTDISVTEANELIQQNADDPNFVLLDVRTAAEFAAGHIAGAENLDVRSGTFADDIAAYDKSKTYLVYCLGGVRSGEATDIMSGQGFTKLYDMVDGYSGWTSAGLPTTTE